jgi:hypothetical protein
MRLFLELFGWYGAAAIVAGYMLVSFSILEPTSLWFQLLNATGALGVLSISFYERSYQPGVLNTVWMLIAIVAIFNILF